MEELVSELLHTSRWLNISARVSGEWTSIRVIRFEKEDKLALSYNTIYCKLEVIMIS